jgi:hypothetical protein
MGAGRGVADFAARTRAGESKSCTEEEHNEALDEGGAQGYSDGAYKKSRRGVAFAPALSVQCGWIALTCYAALEPDG